MSILILAEKHNRIYRLSNWLKVTAEAVITNKWIDLFLFLNDGVGVGVRLMISARPKHGGYTFNSDIAKLLILDRESIMTTVHFYQDWGTVFNNGSDWTTFNVFWWKRNQRMKIRRGVEFSEIIGSGNFILGILFFDFALFLFGIGWFVFFECSVSITLFLEISWISPEVINELLSS